MLCTVYGHTSEKGRMEPGTDNYTSWNLEAPR